MASAFSLGDKLAVLAIGAAWLPWYLARRAYFSLYLDREMRRVYGSGSPFRLKLLCESPNWYARVLTWEPRTQHFLLHNSPDLASAPGARIGEYSHAEAAGKLADGTWKVKEA